MKGPGDKDRDCSTSTVSGAAARARRLAREDQFWEDNDRLADSDPCNVFDDDNDGDNDGDGESED
jgi:hypothetical protein